MGLYSYYNPLVIDKIDLNGKLFLSLTFVPVTDFETENKKFVINFIMEMSNNSLYEQLIKSLNDEYTSQRLLTIYRYTY